jgi:hypothetical protein
VVDGHGEILDPIIPKRSSLFEFLLSSTDPTAYWCFEHLNIPEDDGQSLAVANRDRTAISVTDGSCKETYGTAS